MLAAQTGSQSRTGEPLDAACAVCNVDCFRPSTLIDTLPGWAHMDRPRFPEQVGASRQLHLILGLTRLRVDPVQAAHVKRMKEHCYFNTSRQKTCFLEWEAGLPREVHLVLRLARLGMAEHVLEAVAPPQLMWQIGLPGHEVVARLRYALKSDDDFSVHLKTSSRG